MPRGIPSAATLERHKIISWSQEHDQEIEALPTPPSPYIPLFTFVTFEPEGVHVWGSIHRTVRNGHLVIWGRYHGQP